MRTSACAVRPVRRIGRTIALVMVASALVAIALGLLAGWGVSGDAVPRGVAVTQVHAGETLWDVAERAAPDRDTSAVVQRIRELNGLSSNQVLAGQPLRVPVDSDSGQ
ncbi:MAG: LysM peptidoglycan-binding domain-containing protein [Sciscionella sp.]|nr:LysM peptidoglycan-binding domain-containing protein [Sciscionella sp.]